ncbi:alcohol dehydrogenase catalytic domain-containing protein [bacterium]|nr:alcohol dehydrogenase catalytic domain-containing protein [bacterium]
MSHSIPATAQAVQLTGPDSLELNPAKPVPKPEPHQLLLKVEATGLCYSDLKLLKQFDTHVRKTEVISGIDTSILPQIPSYVPGKKPTVPGHEAVVRVVSAGPETRHPVGDLFLVQADYRWLLTESNNGAFGYDFEGALQEYVLVDERVITSPEGDSMLLPVKADLSLSAIASSSPGPASRTPMCRPSGSPPSPAAACSLSWTSTTRPRASRTVFRPTVRPSLSLGWPRVVLRPRSRAARPRASLPSTRSGASPSTISSTSAPPPKRSRI